MSLAPLATTLLLAGLFLACAQPTTGNNPAKASLELSVLAPRSRAALPEDCAILSYALKGTGPSGATLDRKETEPSIALDLVPGDWEITVEGLSAQGTALAKGALKASLGPGERRTATLVLYPLTGTGTLSLLWSTTGISSTGLRVKGSLIPGAALADSPIPIAIDFPAVQGSAQLAGLTAGAYRLEIVLAEGEDVLCGLAESILIVAGMETTAELGFSPPDGRLVSLLTVPDFTGSFLSIVPAVRRVAPGIQARYWTSPQHSGGTWYGDGAVLGVQGESAVLTRGSPGTARLDWIGDTGGIAETSATAVLTVGDPTGLGPYAWVESIVRADHAADSPARALDDCRDLVFTNQGDAILGAGKIKSVLGLFSYAGPGTIAPLSDLDEVDDQRLGTPGKVKTLGSGSQFLALSEPQGRVSLIDFDKNSARMEISESLEAAELIGAGTWDLTPQADIIYIPVPGSNSIYRIGLGETQPGEPQLGEGPAAPSAGEVHLGEPQLCADAGVPGLELFSKPVCLAVRPDGAILVVGTTGDDALYFFSIAGEAEPGQRGELSLIERIPKETISPFASLSDPVSLGFSSDGESLYVVSYYGKAIIRLDRSQATGLYRPAAALKSGVGGARGFDYPKKIALSPDGAYAALAATGTNDGLSLFDLRSAGSLAYLGTLPSSGGDGTIFKPVSLAFSPDSRTLIAASMEEDKLVVLYRTDQ